MKKSFEGLIIFNPLKRDLTNFLTLTIIMLKIFKKRKIISIQNIYEQFRSLFGSNSNVQREKPKIIKIKFNFNSM